LTAWSEVKKYVVLAPGLLQAPILSKNELEGFVGDKFDLSWQKLAGSKNMRSHLTILSMTNSDMQS